MKKKAGPVWLWLGLAALFITIPGSASASPGPGGLVQLVEVQTSVVGTEIPQLLQDRIQIAVSRVAKKALIDQEIDTVSLFKEQFQRSLAEVFSSTITGFQVERLQLLPGSVSLIEVVFRPGRDRVRAVGSVFAPPGELPEWVQTELTEAFQQTVPKLKKLYHGVPIQALAWAGPALFQEAQALLPSVPGFQFQLSVTPGDQMELRTVAVPQDPRIYKVQLSAVSSTLPPALVRQLHSQIRLELSYLTGLPVEFARSKRSDLEWLLERQLLLSSPVKDVGLSYQVTLNISPVTEALVTVNSSVYKLVAEGAINFGRELNPEVDVEVGRYISPATRIIAGFEMPVTSMGIKPEVGLGTHVFNGDLVFLYSLAEQKPELRFEYQLDRTQRIRLKRDWSQNEWELAYGLDNSDYLTTEIVGNTSGIWFRLVGSL